MPSSMGAARRSSSGLSSGSESRDRTSSRVQGGGGDPAGALSGLVDASGRSTARAVQPRLAHRARVVPSATIRAATSSEIKEMTMLELSAVDFDALGMALEDHSDFTRWFIDPTTGEILPWSEDIDEASPEETGARYIDPVPSYEAYGDMRDFAARVPERRAADLLSRAIEGRGAFRRFKDTL